MLNSGGFHYWLLSWPGCLVIYRYMHGMTEERDKLREYVHDVANPRIEDG